MLHPVIFYHAVCLYSKVDTENYRKSQFWRHRRPVIHHNKVRFVASMVMDGGMIFNSGNDMTHKFLAKRKIETVIKLTERRQERKWK